MGFVCLFVRITQTQPGRFTCKLAGGVEHRPRKSTLYFGDDSDHWAAAGKVFVTFNVIIFSVNNMEIFPDIMIVSVADFHFFKVARLGSFIIKFFRHICSANSYSYVGYCLIRSGPMSVEEVCAL